MPAYQSKYSQFKQIFNKINPDFAWEVMNLEIEVEQTQKQETKDLMRLIQLYMTGVEVLQNADDKRYMYFNNKIHSLMLKKSVIQKLHHLTTGETTKQKTLELIKQKQMEDKKSEYELQLYLQKQSYTISSIKEFLNKEEKQTIKRQSNIHNHVMVQHENLEKRINNRKLRSNSKNKPQSIEKQNEEKVVHRQFAQYKSSQQSRQKKDKSKLDKDD